LFGVVTAEPKDFPFRRVDPAQTRPRLAWIELVQYRIERPVVDIKLGLAQIIYLNPVSSEGLRELADQLLHKTGFICKLISEVLGRETQHWSRKRRNMLEHSKQNSQVWPDAYQPARRLNYDVGRVPRRMKCARLLAVQMKFQAAHTGSAPARDRRERENARTNRLGASLGLAECLEEFTVRPCSLSAKIAEPLVDRI